MKLFINNQVFELENKESSIEIVLKKIDEITKKENMAVSHLVIDHVEVYDNYENYISAHINSIENINAVIKPVKELIMDIFLSAEDYLKRALPELKELISEFYQKPTNESWERFNEFLCGLEWIQNFIALVDNGSYHPMNWDKYLIAISTIHEELRNLEDAITNNDSTLLADIMQYEIYPQLDILKQEIGITIDHEGKRHVN
jgi:hypothetical protein